MQALDTLCDCRTANSESRDVYVWKINVVRSRVCVNARNESEGRRYEKGRRKGVRDMKRFPYVVPCAVCRLP